MKKTCFFCINAKTKVQISCAVTTQLVSAFAFTIWIVRSHYFLNLKFQASSHLLWLCRTWSENPKDRFSQEVAQMRCLSLED